MTTDRLVIASDEGKSMSVDNRTLAPGFWVAVTLAENAAPLRSYVGQIQAVDGHGIRLKLVDWLVGAACGDDLYVPWGAIRAGLISTPPHDQDDFLGRAEQWQAKMTEPPPLDPFEQAVARSRARKRNRHPDDPPGPFG